MFDGCQCKNKLDMIILILIYDYYFNHAGWLKRDCNNRISLTKPRRNKTRVVTIMESGINRC